MKCLTWSNYGIPEDFKIFKLDDKGEEGAVRDAIFETELKAKKSVFTLWQETSEGSFTKMEEINFECKFSD